MILPPFYTLRLQGYINLSTYKSISPHSYLLLFFLARHSPFFPSLFSFMNQYFAILPFCIQPSLFMTFTRLRIIHQSEPFILFFVFIFFFYIPSHFLSRLTFKTTNEFDIFFPRPFLVFLLLLLIHVLH